MIKKGFVSVIIPTYNNESTIGECLSSVVSQTFKKIEIIVVDYKSRDKTLDIAKSFTPHVLSSNSGISKSRNEGISVSKGEFIFSVDSDMVIDKDLIKDCLSKIREFDALIIHEISIGQGFWSECKKFERSFYSGEPTMESPRFFKRKSLEAVGFYDGNLVFGEDRDVMNKMISKDMKVGTSDYLIYHNEGKLSLSKLFKKNLKYGSSFLYYKNKYPLLAKKHISLCRIFIFLKNWKKLFLKPHLTLGMVFMLLVQYIAFNYGMFKTI